MTYQPEAETIRWKVHFRSPPEAVYRALTSSEERKKYWAESVEEESEGVLRYVFLNGLEDRGRILHKNPPQIFRVIYFGMDVTFEINSDGSGGTDLTLAARQVPESERMEISAGWVSWLLTIKAAVDFGIDLRNHDPERTWFHGYADN